MEEKDYFSEESCLDLSGALIDALDNFKYFVTVFTMEELKDRRNEFSEDKIEEILEGFESIAGSCEDFLHSYNYYLKKYEEEREEE